MNFNLLPWALSWVVLALIVIFLIVYRRTVASREDDSIHLEGSMPTEQVALAHKLEMIDRWGKGITAILVVYGLTLAGLYVYQLWTNVPNY
jgi:heme/copper-type cytochrome/quinol oxidase subunit 2